jgi:hypothetical protein
MPWNKVSPTPPPTPRPSPHSPPAIRALRGGAEPEPAAAAAQQAHKDFGKADEDFYPTEIQRNTRPDAPDAPRA